jgi:hypothetical protein
MNATLLKSQLMEEISILPTNKIQNVILFVNFLKLQEDDWFVDFVNKRTLLAKKDKSKAKSFSTLESLQKEYR